MNPSLAVQEQTVNWRGIGIYTGIAGVGAISVVVLARAIGSISGPLAAVIFLFMFTPAISAVIARWFTGCGYSNAGLRIGKLRWYGYGYLVSLAMCAFVFAVAWMIGAAKVDLSLERLAALNPTNAATAEPPEGMTEQQFILVLAFANLTVVNIPGMLLGFGEEFGWRGYLFPTLLPLGKIRAFIIVGFVWWAWHLPLAFIQAAQNQSKRAV